jgi:excinuclease ABC subunit A
MSKNSARGTIRLRGVRHHNLKNFDLDLPIGKLIVVTGLSGSGKSSLAFDTLFAEGQRRYIETFSPYARQFFDRMDKPKVDRIEGIPPAIAIEQRNAVKTTRSTVGTMTELTDYMKLLWPHLATLHCRGCGKPVTKETPAQVWNAECGMRSAESAKREVLITFNVPLSEKISAQESLSLIAKQGYQRVLLNGEVTRIDEALSHSALRAPHSAFTVVQDRIRLSSENRSRFIEACEQAYHFGKGKLTVFEINGAKPHDPRAFSNRFHCAQCDIEYREPTPALFSFNHPLGACPTCRGFGRTITIDYNLAIPDRSKTLAGGAIKPWQVGHGLQSQTDLKRACKGRGVPMDVPFARLTPEQQRFVIDGDPDYGKDEEHEWPRAWYGIKGYFRWLESKSYKMHVRVMLARYRAYTTCPDCHGKRFQPDALLYKLNGLTLADFYQLAIRDAVEFIDHVAGRAVPSAPGLGSSRGNETHSLTRYDQSLLTSAPTDLMLNDALPGSLSRSRCSSEEQPRGKDPLHFALGEVRARLGFLNDVGLGYLTLDRPTRSLSGGETERVNLTTCLGTRLVNTLYVLDEPSVGLHPRDTDRLVRILEQLRDIGNTVVVVEHEPAVMRAADYVVDLGPGHGESGGQIVFQGPYDELLDSDESLTGQYLSGRKQIEAREPRPVERRTPKLRIENANAHNLKNISVDIPLGRFVCLTGVSGSGKTTLAREVLVPLLQQKLGADTTTPVADEQLDEEKETTECAACTVSGYESLGGVVLVDQSPLGRTPRSNPAVYVGAFEFVRELFAMTEDAKQRGLNASAFSFNSAQGQCEKCKGAGFEKIEMQFLSDVFIRCGECDGRRYREHILEVKVSSSAFRVSSSSVGDQTRNPKPETRNVSWSIGDFLDATIDECIEFLRGLPESRHRERALGALKLLQDVGLGYLRAGQPINTLSGGESQRLKLVSHLAESGSQDSTRDTRRRKLFIFDEPTTGLHFDDVRVLVDVFQRLVEEGHSLLVIEHNLELIRCADWVIDLGPEAGDRGGEVVAQGAPGELARSERSFTAAALRESERDTSELVQR